MTTWSPLTNEEAQAQRWQVFTPLADDRLIRSGPNVGFPNYLRRRLIEMENRAAWFDVQRRRSDADLRARLRTLAGTSTAPVSMLAFGDSITAGDNSADGTGYRGHLVDILDRADVAASIDRTGAVNGLALSGLAPLVPGILAANPGAKIALLMIGTNDCNANDLANWQNRYAALVDQILASAPDMKVACARIVITDPSAAQASIIPAEITLNTWIDAVVDPRVSTGRVVKVDMATIPSTWLLDEGWHPGDAAYLRMAQLWANAISGWL